MKRLLATVALLAFAASPALAQQPETLNPGTNAPVGQGYPNTAINGAQYLQNTDPVGFSEYSATPAVGAGTTQATATLITTRVTLITSCPTGAGFQLPSVPRYTAISVVNRSGAACLVYPTNGATVETALGTMGAVNVADSMATNTDTIFRPIVTVTSAAGVTPVTYSVAWYQ